ncbi:hypothetical protein MML48_9g00002315 [Holotrichia oblita]|uniref:Uncharacterized protein n=1 Tax=Holotrichia oblita TaxID=644536 RepID=A0ACB9SJU8_HOLOL|nr:hypothetical protein MML48_9g00002315 [Holotrichia oblita]
MDNINRIMNVYNVEDDEDDNEIQGFIVFGVPRQLYVRQNHFDNYDEANFERRFRLQRNTVLQFLQLIEHQLEYAMDMNNSVSPMNQLLVCLRFYSTGGHLQAIADFAGMHVSTVSRIIKRVSAIIAALGRRYIKFPDTQEAIKACQRKFYDVASFPRVIGAIDCTHIKIESPGGNDAELFRNRKSFFSINVQLVCDADLKIMNVVARWPGATHDSTIFNNSRLYAQFETNQYPQCILLGDSGYPNKPYLFTPLLNPVSPEEQLYNEAHIRTRNKIERCFGVLKRRFPVLAYGCRLKLETVQAVIVATVVLYNFIKENGNDIVPPLPEELDQHAFDILIDNGQIPDIHAHEAQMGEMRQEFINAYFRNLV